MDHNALDSAIGDLGQRVTNIFIRKDGDFWKSAWADVRRIGSAFKEVRYPTGPERQAAWERFQQIVDGMKAQREQHHLQNEQRAESSTSVRREIESLARMADPSAGAFEDFVLTVSGVKPMVALGRGPLEGIGLLDSKDGIQERKKQLEGMNRAIKRAWDSFENNKERLLPADRAGCFEVLKCISDRIQTEWAEWKRLSSKVREDKAAHFKSKEAEFERKRELKRRLIGKMRSLDPTEKSASDESNALLASWKQVGFAGGDYEESLWSDFKSAMDSFWRRRKAGAAERLSSTLDKLRDLRSRLMESLERYHSNSERFKDQRDSAWSDGYRSKMDEIIEDIASKVESKLEKLRDVNKSIEELERKLRDMR